jgi:hypothetical protein
VPSSQQGSIETSTSSSMHDPRLGLSDRSQTYGCSSAGVRAFGLGCNGPDDRISDEPVRGRSSAVGQAAKQQYHQRIASVSDGKVRQPDAMSIGTPGPLVSYSGRVLDARMILPNLRDSLEREAQ